MDEIPPPLAPGFVRVIVRLYPDADPNPGEVARASGLKPEDLGPVLVRPGAAQIDVLGSHLKSARAGLQRLGQTRVADLRWRWLRLGVGRNHGLTIGQLRRILFAVEAGPLGRIHINNTHCMVGLQDFRIEAATARLAQQRVNGYNPRPEALPPGQGPGNAAFVHPTPAQG